MGLTRDRLHCFGFGFARAIWTCGGNPRPIQRTLHRAFLESLRDSGSKATFEILAAGDPCENCETLSGRVWTIAEALSENPLPCRECLNTNEHGYGWCRCEYQQRLHDDLESIIRDIEADIEVVHSRSGAAVTVWQSDQRTIQTRFGGLASIEEVAKIASNGWHKVRNRGKRGMHDGCNGAIEALHEAGIEASTTPNRERPVFNDIVVRATDGRAVVLTLSTSTWEFVERRE